MFNELKNMNRGPKPVEKISFLNNVGLFLGARRKVINEFKSRTFSIKNLDEISTPEAEVAAPEETKLKLKLKF